MTEQSFQLPDGGHFVLTAVYRRSTNGKAGEIIDLMLDGTKRDFGHPVLRTMLDRLRTPPQDGETVTSIVEEAVEELRHLLSNPIRC